jgi:hypothetical protein
MARPRKPAVHSLIGQYSGIPQDDRIAAVDIDDPYGSAGRYAIDIGGSSPIRDDVAAKMFARHQIDRACYLAARSYQATHETAGRTLVLQDSGCLSERGH